MPNSILATNDAHLSRASIVGTGAFTFFSAFKATDSSNYHAVIGGGDSGAARFELVVENGTGRLLSFRDGGVGDTQLSANIVDGRWHFLAYTRTAGGLWHVFLIDAEDVATPTFEFNANLAAGYDASDVVNLYIYESVGQGYVDNSNGKIPKARASIWNVDFTQAQFLAECAGPSPVVTSGLIYHCDFSSTANVGNDTSGAGNNFTRTLGTGAFTLSTTDYPPNWVVSGAAGSIAYPRAARDAAPTVSPRISAGFASPPAVGAGRVARAFSFPDLAPSPRAALAVGAPAAQVGAAPRLAVVPQTLQQPLATIAPTLIQGSANQPGIVSTAQVASGFLLDDDVPAFPRATVLRGAPPALATAGSLAFARREALPEPLPRPVLLRGVPGAVFDVGGIAAATWTALDATDAVGAVSDSGTPATAAWSALDGTPSLGVASDAGTVATASWSALDAADTVTGQDSGTPALATWSALDGTPAAGAVADAGTLATATWSALDGTASAGQQTDVGGVALASWSALDGSVLAGAISDAGAPAAGTWASLDATPAPGAISDVGTLAAASWVALDASVTNEATSIGIPALCTWSALDAAEAVGATSVAGGVALATWSALTASVQGVVRAVPVSARWGQQRGVRGKWS